MSDAAILCTQCGASSPAPALQCAKCGGKNARVCGGCGFKNSVAKNYCDKCGKPISVLGPSVAPPPQTSLPDSAKDSVPATLIRKVTAAPPSSPLPPAKAGAVEPGAAMSAPIPVAGRQDPDPFAVSGDPWAPVAPAPATAPKPKASVWIGVLRRAVSAALGTVVVFGALAAVWYASEHRKPENASRFAATAYLDALSKGSYPAAYALLSEAARNNCTLEEFIASRDTHTWTWSRLRVEHVEPGAVLLAYDLAIAGSQPRVDHVLFVEEKGKWVRPYSWALVRKVEEAFEKNDAEMGLVLAQAAAIVDPRDPMARGYLCEAAYYRKSPEDAERQCNAALELSRVYPSNLTPKSLYHLHAILADTYKNALRKPELALEQFSTMLAFPNISAADQCEILLARSETQQVLSRPGEALSDANRAGQLCVRPQDLAYIEEIRRKLNAPPP